MTKLIVVELKDGVDVGEIANFMTGQYSRMAVVDSVPSVFTSFPNAVEPKLPSKAADASSRESSVETTGDSKEDQLMHKATFGDESNAEEEEFVDAADVEEFESRPEFRSMLKSRKRRMMEREDYDVYSKRRNPSDAKDSLSCGLCKSVMTLRSGYGRSRLKDHVLRHLNIPAAQCGICGYTGALSENIRRHHKMKHDGEERICLDLTATEEFEQRYKKLWKTCFPDTLVMPVVAKKIAKTPATDSLDDTTEPDALSQSVMDIIETLLCQAEEQAKPQNEEEIKP